MNKKSSIKKIISSFILVFAILSIWQINISQTWKSHGKFIVLGKGEAEKNTINQITENILYFPYNIEGIQLKRIEKSGIIEITAQGKDRSSSEYLLEDSFRSIFYTISKLYNVKTELSLRIVEKKEAQFNILNAIRDKLLLKIIVSFIFSYLFLTLTKKIASRKNILSKKMQRVAEKTPTSKKENLTQKKPLAKSSKTNIAPDNLPLAGDEIEKMFGAIKNGSGYKIEGSSKEDIVEEKKEETSVEEDLIKEATPEEVKERLNKLLGSI